MKKRFLPFSLLLVIMVLGQSMAIADQGGHYVPRTQTTMNAESFMGSLRANQNTGLIDPADMFKAMQVQATRNGANDPLYWISMGPDNMGGQTTAVVYDNRLYQGHPNGVVYIGSKGGGVYKTYNYGVTWHHVGNLNLMVSCMIQDADGTIYVGTGDGSNGVNYNGLDQQGYDNSFAGTGLYKLVDDAFELVKAPTADEWLYINDLAIAGSKLLAATDDGLMYSNDKGQTWAVAVEGKAVAVKVAKDNTIVAGIDGQVYIGADVEHLVCHSGTGSTLQGDTLLPKAAAMIDIAIAPTNDNVIYVSCIGTDGNHSGVFVSNNKGQNWAMALPSVTANQGHLLYGGFGTYNHCIVVDPVDEGGHVPLMLERFLERLEEGTERDIGLGDGGQMDPLAVLMEVVPEDECMVAFLRRLDLEVVRVAGKAFLLVVVGEGEVEICAVKLGVDLLVDQLDDVFLHDASFLFGILGIVPRQLNAIIILRSKTKRIVDNF